MENLSFEKTFELPKFTQFLNLVAEKPEETRDFLDNSQEIPLEQPNPNKRRRNSKKSAAKPAQISKKLPKSSKKVAKSRSFEAEVEEFQGTPRKKLKKEAESPGNHAISAQNRAISVRISVIFEQIFQFALKNLFHASWERRHSSCLIIRSFLAQNFANLGFSLEVSLESQEISGKIATLREIQREIQRFSTEKREKTRRIVDILTRFLVVVSLDRFGDFLFEKVRVFLSNCRNFL